MAEASKTITRRTELTLTMRPVLNLRLYVTGNHTESVLRGPFTNAQVWDDGTGESYVLISGRHLRPKTTLR